MHFHSACSSFDPRALRGKRRGATVTPVGGGSPAGTKSYSRSSSLQTARTARALPLVRKG